MTNSPMIHTISGDSTNAHEKTFPRFVWIIALVSGIRLRIIGDIYLGEIFAVIIVLDNLLKGSRRVSSRSKLDFFAYFWVSLLIISSLLNNSNLKSTLFTVGAALLTIFIFKAFLIVYRRGFAISQILMRIFLGQAFAGLLQPKDYGLINGWKYQYGYALGAFLILIIYKRVNIQIVRVLLIVLVIISIANSARSLASFFLIAFILSLPKPSMNRNVMRKSSSVYRFLIVGLALITVYFSYLASAKAGYLGSKEIARAERLTTSVYGPLVGRSEIFYSLEAIQNSPFFGYGSSPNLSSEFLLKISTDLNEQGLRNENGAYLLPNKLPVHSIILGAAVYAGLPATIFWMIGLFYSSKFVKFFKYFTREDRIVIVLISVAEFWNILFSPYGALLRISVSCSFAFLYVLYTERIPDQLR